MTDTIGDFARLFRIDGIGQVLVTIDENEADDLPCLRFRLPELGGIIPAFSFTSHFPNEMPDAEVERRMRDALSKVTEEMIAKEARPIIEMVKSLSDEGGA